MLNKSRGGHRVAEGRDLRSNIFNDFSGRENVTWKNGMFDYLTL